MASIYDRKISLTRLLNPKRWWFMASIVWRPFTDQQTMFDHYGYIVVRVPLKVALYLAFTD